MSLQKNQPSSDKGIFGSLEHLSFSGSLWYLTIKLDIIGCWANARIIASEGVEKTYNMWESSLN